MNDNDDLDRLREIEDRLDLAEALEALAEAEEDGFVTWDDVKSSDL